MTKWVTLFFLLVLALLILHFAYLMLDRDIYPSHYLSRPLADFFEL